jgi:hypothetical protein
MLLAVALLLAAPLASALEIEGVEFPARIELKPAGALLLNGAGIRTAFFLDIYAAGLYLPIRTSSAAQVIAGPGPQRMTLQLLREVSGERFSSALEDGLRANHSEAQMQQLAPRVERLRAIMTDLGATRAGMRIDLDRVPGTGTVVAIDGVPRGEPIPGDDFYQALLKNWIGEHPVSADLKRALLAATD